MEAFVVALASVWAASGFSALTGGHVIMICVGLILLYMAIGKGFELCCCPRSHSVVFWLTFLKTVLNNLALCP